MNDPRQPSGMGPTSPGIQPPGAPRLQPGLQPARPAPPPIAPPPKPPTSETDSVALVDDGPEIVEATPASKKIKFGPDVHHHKEHAWKRQPKSSPSGACRVKSFHGKYSDQGVEYLDELINQWLDSHPEADVKFVTSTVGVFEGKIREPALVLNLWY